MTSELSSAVGALGKIMGALAARRLLARGVKNAVIRAKLEGDALTDEFRPGLSKLWIDNSEPAPLLPTWMEEFGDDVFARLGRDGEHYGSACESLDCLRRWFNPTEMQRLAKLGFQIVSFGDARILAKSASQVVFARRQPLTVGAAVREWP